MPSSRLLLPDVVDGRGEVRGVVGGGLLGFIQFGKVAIWNTFGNFALRDSHLLRNLLLRPTCQPQLEYLTVAAKEAKELQKQSKGRGKKGPVENTDLNGNGDARDQAAAEVGISGSSVSKFKTIQEELPDVAHQVAASWW